MRKSPVGIPLLMVLALTFPPCSKGGIDKESLRNLKRIYLSIVVEEACKSVLDPHTIEQALALKLRITGLEVTDTARNSDAMLQAEISCSPVAIGSDHRLLGYAADIQLELKQEAMIGRLAGQSILATTWQALGTIMTCSPTSCGDRVQRYLDVQMNEFLNDYLSVNPPNGPRKAVTP